MTCILCVSEPFPQCDISEGNKEIFINESFEERMSFISSNAAMLDRIYYVLSPEEQREGGELYESA